MLKKSKIEIQDNKPFKYKVSKLIKLRMRRREEYEDDHYVLAIIDKKTDPKWVYRKSHKNHSFWTLKRNGAENEKISLPVIDWSVLDRYGYWIIGTKKLIAEIKRNSKEDTEMLIKQVIKQECPKGSCPT